MRDVDITTNNDTKNFILFILILLFPFSNKCRHVNKVIHTNKGIDSLINKYISVLIATTVMPNIAGNSISIIIIRSAIIIGIILNLLICKINKLIFIKASK